MKNKKVVVIGGGHGQSTILRGIKEIDGIDLTAIVTVADDGGSTGRLRRRFHIPAMGDIRNVLISLAEHETLLSQLMNYRFEMVGDDENDLDVEGHNLGNLILTAMTDSTGSFMDAISILSKVLNVKGTIIPSSLQVITLFAIMEDGTIVQGEANIPNFNNRISKVFYDRKVYATPLAIKAILEADLIIYGIGSLYTSILPNLIIEDIDDALKETKAQKVYFCNIMSQPGETDRYTLEDHVEALNKHGAFIDKVIMANDEIPKELIVKYSKEGSTIVKPKRMKHDYEIIYESLLDFKDNLIRHDSQKIKKAVEKLLK